MVVKQQPIVAHPPLRIAGIISDWYVAYTDDGTKIDAYYHIHYGWMIKGSPASVVCSVCANEHHFKYGYVPLTKTVIDYEAIF